MKRPVLFCFDGSDGSATALVDGGAVLGRGAALVLTVWESVTGKPIPPMQVRCGRCHNTGYFGSGRPRGRMLAIDVAWSDDDQPHVRIIGPKTDRRRGEALHALHVCQVAPAHAEDLQQAA